MALVFSALLVLKVAHTTLDFEKLEHGCMMIHVGVPPLLVLGSAGGRVSYCISRLFSGILCYLLGWWPLFYFH